MSNRWRTILVTFILLAAMACGPGAETTTPTPSRATLEPEQSEVWHWPLGQPTLEVEGPTSAGHGDKVWTDKGGKALLMWEDLWVRLYSDTELHVEECEIVTDICAAVGFGTALNGGVSRAAERITFTTKTAEIKSTGTTVMVSYHPSSQLTVVRVFDGQAEVRNLTGEVQETKPVSADEWALVEPGEPSQVSDKLEDMRGLAEELGLWDVFHEVELDVRGGFGPGESRVTPTLVRIVFEVTPTPTDTLTPRPTRTRTPTPTPTVIPLTCATPMPGFGQIWTTDATIRSRLGCPVESERVTWSAEETFIGGYMLWRQELRLIYVLYDDGTWQSFVDNWYEGDTEWDPAIIPPPDYYQPKRGFGKVWREQAEVRDRLGWARTKERGLDAPWQAYEDGLVMWSDRQGFFVLYNDGTWSRHS